MDCFTKHFSSLILFLLLLTWCDADLFQHKVHLQISNHVGEGLNLTVRCKSKDDDLGNHVISYQNKWEFHFRPNFLGSTLFYCSMAWKDAFHWFDIFIYERDYVVCKVCEWSVKPEGPCRFANATNKFEYSCFSWK
ncbi:hypothetical protein REPUB_Repub20aG0067800 [Reevesia pubescens]